jgi:hypothetical protein
VAERSSCFRDAYLKSLRVLGSCRRHDGTGSQDEQRWSGEVAVKSGEDWKEGREDRSNSGENEGSDGGDEEDDSGKETI